MPDTASINGVSPHHQPDALHTTLAHALACFEKARTQLEAAVARIETLLEHADPQGWQGTDGKRVAPGPDHHRAAHSGCQYPDHSQAFPG
jgi:hypothetical protein